MTRKIFYVAATVALAAVVCCAQTPAGQSAAKKSTPTKKQAAPAKAGVPARTNSTRTVTRTAASRTASSRTASSRTASSRTASSRNTRKPVPRTTWRNRQTTPSPERYREIQEALVSKGYLKPEEAAGAWGESSTTALKRFQADQNLESTGKINSLSLIALGLGPKHESVVVPKPPVPPVQ